MSVVTGADSPSAPASDVPASDVPRWAYVVGVLLALAFIELSAQAYFGRSTVDRVAALVPRKEMLAAAPPPVYHVARENQARVGRLVIDADGRDRALVVGDLVLVGELGRLVRVERDGRPTTLDAAAGTTVEVANLGPWDARERHVGGLAATAAGGRWTVSAPAWTLAGHDLRLPGPVASALPEGFWRSPSEGPYEVTRLEDADGPYYRFDIVRSMPFLVLSSRDPLADVDEVPITVRALARARSGALMTLTIFDVVDETGRTETSMDKRQGSESWEELRVSTRARYPSQGDNFSFGVFDAQPRDWFEVRGLDLVVGLLP